MKNSPEYASIVVRLSISLLFLWFGINQLSLPEDFLGYLPGFLLQQENPGLFVFLNGIFETVLGFMLLIGWKARWIALILSVHLLSIAVTLGYNDIFIRDAALTLVTFSIFLRGEDGWCLKK